MLRDSACSRQRILIGVKVLGNTAPGVMLSPMEKTVQRIATFAEAEKADRDFYKKLTGNERLQLLLELCALPPEQRLERVYRIIKFSELRDARR